MANKLIVSRTNFSDLNRPHDRYERAPTRGRPKVTGSWGNRWQTRRLNSLKKIVVVYVPEVLVRFLTRS
mgnify:CR=1 FL=1